MNQPRMEVPRAFGVIVLLVIVLIGGVFAVFLGLYSIPTSQAGIIVDPVSKGISGPVIGPAYGLKWPWQSIVTVPYTVNFLTMSDDKGADYPAFSCFTSDRIDVLMSLTIRYEIDPTKVLNLYRNYPTQNWEYSTMHSISQQIIKTDTKDYTWTEYSTKRDEIATKIQNDLQTAFTAESTFAGAITNVEFNMNNVKYPDVLIAELEKTTAAQQSIVTASNQRQATLINANATALSQIIQAEGQAKSIETIKAEFGDQWPLYYTMSQLNNIAEKGGIVIWSNGQVPNVVIPQNQTKTK